MTRTYLYLLLALLLAPVGLVAQNVAFEKANFPNDRDGYKQAQKEINYADKQYEEGPSKFGEALKYYLKANKFNPNNAELNYKIANCYLRGSNEKLKSLPYFEKAFKLDPGVHQKLTYYMGIAYHLNGDWDKALDKFDVYLNSIPPEMMRKEAPKVKKRMEECRNGKKLSENPSRVFLDNIGAAINSKYPDYAPVISTDESVMMYTSRRENTTGGKMDEFRGEYFEDIYYCDNKDGKWGAPTNMGKPINSNTHDATVAISPDGQKLLTYMEGGIYASELKGTEWSKPRKLDKTINSDFHESSASYSFDGKTLYFVSTRPDGSMGGRDIYRSSWDAKKERWGPAANLGATINTKYDEESVFAHPDGKTLYFSSKGHNSMGGYDVFSTVFENGRWTRPVNLGTPINSPDDDLSFVVSASGRKGYFSSIKPDGYGDRDIYILTFLGPEKQVVLNTEDNLMASIAAPIKEAVIEAAVEVTDNRVTIFTGTVTDDETGDPLEASIELIDNELRQEVAKFTSNSKSGKFLLSLPSGKNYGITVKMEGYLFHSENFVIPASAAYTKITKDIKLQKLKVGKTIVLNNIFFETAKYTLTEASYIELTNLYELLKENPEIKVEISGHTDNVGSDTYNQKLSENRAKAVVDYIVKLGISQSNLVYKGYGEAQPVAPNDTEEGKALNRRTEFKVIE